MSASEEYLFVTCQQGAERAIKADFLARVPPLRLAFSRPGFLTFKGPAAATLAASGGLEHALARSLGASLGRVHEASGPITQGEAPGAAGIESASAAVANSPAWTLETLPQRLVDQVWQVAASGAYDQLHVWQRDAAVPGEFGFEPAATPLAAQLDAALRRTARQPALSNPLSTAQPGQRVLDVVIVEPRQWWIGHHLARTVHGTWPGGIPPLAPPENMVSRAWLKLREALLWSGFVLRPGDCWAEIGCSPGGASQALLELEQRVLGIDPALVAPQIAAHPRFTHLRMRGAAVRRREFRHVRFLAADINVAPSYTLDTVESIVTHPQVDIQGLLLTLKLLDWQLFDNLGEYLDRIRSWGFADVRARQLCFNRQELCVAAAKDTSVLGTAPRTAHRAAPHRAGRADPAMGHAAGASRKSRRLRQHTAGLPATAAEITDR